MKVWFIVSKQVVEECGGEPPWAIAIMITTSKQCLSHEIHYDDSESPLLI